MTSYKVLHAKSSSDYVVVVVEFNEEKQPIKIMSQVGGYEYPIISHVERHGLLTVRNPTTNELMSIFYREIGI